MVHVSVPAATSQSASVSDATAPAGIGSVISAPAGRSDGPAFVSVSVYVVVAPATTAKTTSSLTRDRSAMGSTVVPCESPLSDPSGSGVVEETEAVLESEPSTVVVTTTSTVASAPAAIVPRGM